MNLHIKQAKNIPPEIEQEIVAAIGALRQQYGPQTLELARHYINIQTTLAPLVAFDLAREDRQRVGDLVLKSVVALLDFTTRAARIDQARFTECANALDRLTANVQDDLQAHTASPESREAADDAARAAVEQAAKRLTP